jgi:hypothetical protein
MSKIRYETRSFTSAAEAVIDQAEVICQQYADQGYSLTLRQLYYRFIATDAFPESRRWALENGRWRKDKAGGGTKNADPNYKWLGDLVSDARISGLIDWRHIEDRTRSTDGGDFGWGSPADFVSGVMDQYSITRWDGQASYVEVWVEKEALADVIGRPASRWHVPYMACKGSPSTSAVHDAAQRFRRIERQGRVTHLVYLGDHDPTGIDISRDISDRLAMFRSKVTVDRIALNMDQVREFSPPPSPAKPGDSRTAGYVEQFGTEDTWELDALEPAQLEGLVEDAILGRLDTSLWDEREERERHERVVLTAVADNWPGIVAFMSDMSMIPGEGGE